MHTTKVQLPDGRLLTIEGGTAETTAQLLRNHYLGEVGATVNGAEAPMEMTSLQKALEQEQRQSAHVLHVQQHADNAAAGQEAPLPLPTLVFSR
jgi:hypothetical protein